MTPTHLPSLVLIPGGGVGGQLSSTSVSFCASHSSTVALLHKSLWGYQTLESPASVVANNHWATAVCNCPSLAVSMSLERQCCLPPPSLKFVFLFSLLTSVFYFKSVLCSRYQLLPYFPHISIFHCLSTNSQGAFFPMLTTLTFSQNLCTSVLAFTSFLYKVSRSHRTLSGPCNIFLDMHIDQHIFMPFWLIPWTMLDFSEHIMNISLHRFSF